MFVWFVCVFMQTCMISASAQDEDISLARMAQDKVGSGYMLSGDSSFSGSGSTSSSSDDDICDQLGILDSGIIQVIQQEMYALSDECVIFMAYYPGCPYFKQSDIEPYCQLRRRVVQRLSHAFRMNIKLSELGWFYVDTTDYNGFPLLHYAVMRGNALVVKGLLEEKASVDRKSKSGNAALHIAAGVNLGYDGQEAFQRNEKKWKVFLMI